MRREELVACGADVLGDGREVHVHVRKVHLREVEVLGPGPMGFAGLVLHRSRLR